MWKKNLLSVTSCRYLYWLIYFKTGIDINIERKYYF